MATRAPGPTERTRQGILNAWWNRRYLTGREAEFTYDYVGLALAVTGEYLVVGWSVVGAGLVTGVGG